jgi:hypothetical protein
MDAKQIEELKKKESKINNIEKSNSNTQTSEELLKQITENFAKTYTTATTPIDYQKLADEVVSRLPQDTTAVIQQHSSVEPAECSTPKPICTDKIKFSLESPIRHLETISSLFEEYDLVEIIKSNFKTLKTSKTLRKTKIAEQIPKDILEEGELENEQDLLKKEIKKIDTLLKNELLTRAHSSTKQDLDAALKIHKAKNKDITENIQKHCISETCFDESDLIRNLCGALKYGHSFEDSDS